MNQTPEAFAIANAALVKVQSALAEDRLDDAVALAEEAVGAAPQYTRAISGLATALKRAGRDAEVRQVLTDVPGDLAGSTGDLVAVAAFCLREGVRDSAREILRCALEADPTRVRVAELLAGVYLSEHDPAGVIAVCELFRARGRASAAMLRLQAAAYEHLDDVAAAMECARRYTGAAPLDARGHYHLGTLEHRAGNIPEAMERYELAVDLDRGTSEVAMAATDGIRTLDAIQLRQITALAVTDSVFRIALDQAPREALDERGFALSDDGLALLASLDLNALARESRGGGYDFH